MEIAKEIDCKGLPCPMPIVKIKKAIKAMDSKQVLKVTADDPGFLNDVKAWSEMTENPLLDLTEDNGVFVALVQKQG
jgi:TusA-related sulfurtransferase